jgi:rhodanese-related sulfurtransferase
VPLTALLNAPPDFPKNEEIIAMCGIGYRGNIAASYLEGLGYSHIHSLAGGMKAWLSAGYNVIR